MDQTDLSASHVRHSQPERKAHRSQRDWFPIILTAVILIVILSAAIVGAERMANLEKLVSHDQFEAYTTEQNEKVKVDMEKAVDAFATRVDNIDSQFNKRLKNVADEFRKFVDENLTVPINKELIRLDGEVKNHKIRIDNLRYSLNPPSRSVKPPTPPNEWLPRKIE